VSQDILIIGSGISGVQAGLDLADSGVSVHLIESSPFLGNEGVNRLQQQKVNARLLKVIRHPNITIWTNTSLNRCEEEGGNFQVELRQHPRYVDLDRCTACGDCISVCPVTEPGTDHKVIHLDGQPGGCVIEKSGRPPCSNACPGDIHVQGYIALIAQGRFQEAIELIRKAIPFPGICGRVCTHPCEINCRRNEIDTPVAVRLLKRFVSDWENEQMLDKENQKVPGNNENIRSKPKKVKPKGKKVAIVGAGPGGMTVADRLARLGYKVTVFEKLPVIGGMMAIGIPRYRLPREVIKREYQHIQELGVEVRLNTTIGPGGDYTLDDLFEDGFEAICLAIGAHKGQQLNIPGESLLGVVQGIDVLKMINLSQHVDVLANGTTLQKTFTRGLETRVAVLGGGNTAMDVSRSIKRLGVKQVHVLYRRTRAEMPSMPEEIEEAEHEGVDIEYLVSPARIIGNRKSGVTAIECVRMKLGEPDASGRRRPVPIAGSEFITKIDLVVLAIGQTLDLDILGPDDGIAITRDMRININDTVYMTGRPGVFAVGDAVTKDKMVVIEAIGMGKRAAAAIDGYLRGIKIQEDFVSTNKGQISLREMSDIELVQKPRTAVKTISMEERLNSYAEIELGYTFEQAIQEAQRCLACGPCSECQACVEVCKPGAIDFTQTETYPKLNIKTIINTDGPERNDINNTSIDSFFTDVKGIYRIPPSNRLMGSAGAALACLHLNEAEIHQKNTDLVKFNEFSIELSPQPTIKDLEYRKPSCRSGVFICQCGSKEEGQISRVVDTEAICALAGKWTGVIHAQVLPFSCSPDGANTIKSIVNEQHLNRIVIAGCTCCSIDQVCDSCTYQRIRCKNQLHIFNNPELANPNFKMEQSPQFEFVNIREQCAWVHSDNPKAATNKAMALIASSVARTLVHSAEGVEVQQRNRSTLILGQGSAGKSCFDALIGLGIYAHRMEKLPTKIHRKNGQYVVTRAGHCLGASSLVLSPMDNVEAVTLLDSFGRREIQPRVNGGRSWVDTHRPGIFFIDPHLEPSISGAAASSRVAAWLGRIEERSQLTSVVIPHRCRACGTCIDVCEFGAPEIVKTNGQQSVWIDPIICKDCGICAANCPSGAIVSGYLSDHHIEAMLSSMLPDPISL